MSAPGPEKWMPSSFEILLSLKDLTVDSLSQSVQAPRLTALVKKAARRRAIEELRALAKVMCSDCGKGVEFTVHPFEPKTYFHNGEDLGYWECQCPEIHDRIAAIESEEA